MQNPFVGQKKQLENYRVTIYMQVTANNLSLCKYVLLRFE